MKVIIVGGVAGGASCAARLRRLNEKADIIMVERGPYVSYANCGLPYYVGGVIRVSRACWWRMKKIFREQFAIDVRTRCEASQNLAEEQDCRSEKYRHRRSDHRVVRQTCPVPRCDADPPGYARDRSSRRLQGADRPGC